jgi:glutamate 5-kinase
LIDAKGKVIQPELEALARAAISLKLAGDRVVVAVSKPQNARADYAGEHVHRSGYASVAVSQTKLMSELKRCFDSSIELTAQVLVDAVVFHEEHRAQQLSSVLTELIDMGVIPMVGLSAAGRGEVSSLLDTFLLNLLDKATASSSPRTV